MRISTTLFDGCALCFNDRWIPTPGRLSLSISP